MAPRPHDRASDRAQAPRRPARDLIEAILQNMRENLEPLKFSTLAPSRYLVYLHHKEFARLEGIIPLLQDEAIRALTEALDKLNQRPTLLRYRERITGARTPPVQNAGTAWQIEFVADPDESLNEGDILIESELLLPAQPELGVGERTRRIATVHSGSHHPTRERPPHASPESSPGHIFARLVYDDDTGHHSHDVVNDSVTVGRGGTAYPVDVRIATSPDVSREHARIRRHPETGQFFLIDLSSLGTTLNGRHVPRGYEEADGTKRENGVDTPLPDRARIGLADTVYLEFLIEH
jgi:FHA domain